MQSLDPHPQTRLCGIAALSFGTLAVQFDSAVNIAFPELVRSFALEIPDIQWIVISYTLTYAALMLVFGRAGDMFGHRRIFLLGTATSTVAFILCTMATTYNGLLAARVLQGVGAALTLSCAPALMTSLYPEHRKARALALFTLIFGLGGALGPAISGFLIEPGGWPAVFGFRAPLALLAFVAGFSLPAAVRRDLSEAFDLPGAAMLVLVIGATVLAFNRLQQPGYAAGLALLAAAVIFGAVFIRRESRIAAPLIDVKLFRDPDFALLNAANTLLNLSGFTILLLAPFFLATIGGLSAPMTGLVLAAAPFGVVLGAPAATALAHVASPRQSALLGAVASAIGLIVIGSLGQISVVALIAAALLQGCGLGIFQVAYFDIATTVLPKENRGVAGSLVLVTRTIGIVMSASVLMFVFQHLRSSLEQSGASSTASLLTAANQVFLIAGGVSVLVLAAALLRGWGTRRSGAR